jgi:hypothetical protein
MLYYIFYYNDLMFDLFVVYLIPVIYRNTWMYLLKKIIETPFHGSVLKRDKLIWNHSIYPYLWNIRMILYNDLVDLKSVSGFIECNLDIFKFLRRLGISIVEWHYGTIEEGAKHKSNRFTGCMYKHPKPKVCLIWRDIEIITKT